MNHYRLIKQASSSFLHQGDGKLKQLFHKIPAAAANKLDETQPFSLILPRSMDSLRGVENNVSSSYIKLESGMILLKNYLSLSEQVDIVNICEKGHGGFYQPGYQSGSKLQLWMMCFGRNWDPETKYKRRCRRDGSEPPPVPDELISLVETAILDARTPLNDDDDFPSMHPNICIVNFYTSTGRLGIHQDRDESASSLQRGLPVVSISIGDTSEFLYGYTKDKCKREKVLLESGDVLVFGGESRLIFHGVKTIIPNSAPLPLLQQTMLRPGRLNLTFRQF